MSITKSMYVDAHHVQAGTFYVLRQTRYRAHLLAGQEHPHDICAIARSVEEMHSMVDKHWPNDIDYSLVEPQKEEASNADGRAYQNG